jgi:hypothetical protein
MHSTRRAVVGLLLCLAAAVPARAATLGFDCITNNSLGDCAIGEAQLSMNVTSESASQVRFTFSNSGPAASVISEVYFDDGSLLGIASIVNGTGVVFQQDANPPNLPGGQNAVPPFEVTAGFLAQATPSPAMNGVGPGEFVAIIFNLQNGAVFDDVLAQLGDGRLRAGIHVISYASGGSESFVNAPEPAAALLAAAALGALALRRRAR